MQYKIYFSKIKKHFNSTFINATNILLILFTFGQFFQLFNRFFLQ